MSRLHCGRPTTVGVLGRLVALDQEEPDGTWSADLTDDEAEVMAAAIADGGHPEFEVRGPSAAMRDTVDVGQALSGTRKSRQSAATNTSEEAGSGN